MESKKGNVENWSREDVSEWLHSFLGEENKLEKWKYIDGGLLLRLNKEEVMTLVNSDPSVGIPLWEKIEDIQGYSIQENEKVFKIIVVGNPNTGKTTLLQTYVKGCFTNDYKTTIGCDFCIKEVRWNSCTKVVLQLWDISGQERTRNITRAYYKDAHMALICFAVNDKKSFKDVMIWKNDLDSKVKLPNGQSIPCVLLCNKNDEPSIPDLTSLDDFWKENSFINCFKTSALKNKGIEEAMDFVIKTLMQTYDESINSSLFERRKSVVTLDKKKIKEKE